MNDDGTDELESPVRRNKRFRMASLTMVIVVGGILACLISNTRQAVHETLCHSNLVKLRYALVSYDSVNGSLPPATLLGADGKAAHSWRVLILPFLDSWGIDGNEIYNSYDMAQPWNSSQNHQLFQPVAESRYSCPSGSEVNTIFTNYVVLVGDNTLFPEGQAVSLSDIPNTHDPILVLEITNSDIEWPEPRDLSIAELESTNSVNA